MIISDTPPQPRVIQPTWWGFLGSLLTESSLRIVISAFLWAVTGSHVWILIRFRRFGAAFAFDPAQAQVFQARVYSGAITSAVILYFVFGGGKEAWAQNWQVDLPLWAFVLGYAGRLQVELLTALVERVEDAIRVVLPAKREKTKTTPGEAKKGHTSKTGKQEKG